MKYDGRKNLMPAWRPGQSGNLNGRPKHKPITDMLIHALDQTAIGGRELFEQKTLREIIIIKLVDVIINGDHADRIRAISLVLDRIEGKASDEPTMPASDHPLVVTFRELLDTVKQQHDAEIKKAQAKAKRAARRREAGDNGEAP